MSEENTNPNPTPAEPTGRTFSEEYVKAIREEAKENRLARKAAEEELRGVKAKLKDVLGLKPEDDVDDAKIKAYRDAQEAKITEALQAANARLITAEIRSLEGYDPKLIDRLLDRSKVKIAEDGKVTGLKEAVDALVAEFPQVKVSTPPAGTPGGANPPTPGTLTEVERLKTAYADAEKRRDAVTMNVIMTQIKALKK